MFPNLMAELNINHFSQKEMAAYIGISERSISKKMNGKVDFTLSEMRKIQSVFPNCTLDYLFVQCGQKAPPDEDNDTVLVALDEALDELCWGVKYWQDVAKEPMLRNDAEYKRRLAKLIQKNLRAIIK